jgi:hypothetical protein
MHGHGEQEHPPKVSAFTSEFLQKHLGGGFDGTRSKKRFSPNDLEEMVVEFTSYC